MSSIKHNRGPVKKKMKVSLKNRFMEGLDAIEKLSDFQSARTKGVDRPGECLTPEVAGVCGKCCINVSLIKLAGFTLTNKEWHLISDVVSSATGASLEGKTPCVSGNV